MTKSDFNASHSVVDDWITYANYLSCLNVHISIVSEACTLSMTSEACDTNTGQT